MSELCSCNCGSRQFERLSEKIICSKCKKDIDSNGTAGFFDPSDSKSKEFITLLGIDIGAEAATVHMPVVGSNKPFVGFNRSEGDKYLDSFFTEDFYRKGYISRLRKCHNRVLRELNEVLKSVIKGTAITAAVAVPTIILAGAFTPAIAVALVG